MPDHIIEISLSELQEMAMEVRRDLRSRGEFPDHKRTRPRSEEKERALLQLQIEASCKYGVARADDGTYYIKGLAGKTLETLEQ